MRRAVAGRAIVAFALALNLAGCAASAGQGQAVVVPMTPAEWRLAPLVAWAHNDALRPPGFARYEGMPNGTMTLSDAAIAVSDGAAFSQGTIEFDVKPLAYDDTGIIFHRHGDEDGEFFYLRGSPDCPAADDCFQYAPIAHRQMQWDIYPNEEGPAQIAPAGWNHVRLVVSGARMLVFLNREIEPSLVVPRLQGLREDGGIAFKGPAVYANLVLRPAPPIGVADVRETPEAGAVTAWSVASPSVAAVGGAVDASAIPPAQDWRPIGAEPNGLVNLSRAFDGGPGGAPSVSWLKTVVTASAAGRRTVRIGWARQVSVFLNGRLVFSGDNPYRPVERRLSPNGRLEADNASVPLDLRAGRNEIVLAVRNGWITADGRVEASPYGWAAEMHFGDVSGLSW